MHKITQWTQCSRKYTKCRSTSAGIDSQHE